LITKYFIGRKMPEEDVINNVTIALCHESLHEAICELIGEKRLQAFHRVPDFSEIMGIWLGLHYVTDYKTSLENKFSIESRHATKETIRI